MEKVDSEKVDYELRGLFHELDISKHELRQAQTVSRTNPDILVHAMDVIKIYDQLLSIIKANQVNAKYLLALSERS